MEPMPVVCAEQNLARRFASDNCFPLWATAVGSICSSSRLAGKGVSLATQIRLLALQQTSRLPAGMSPQHRARLSGRITASGKCEVPNSLAPGDTQTDGCEKLCLKTARSRQRCCLLGCHIHLCDKTDGKRIPGITYRD